MRLKNLLREPLPTRVRGKAAARRIELAVGIGAGLAATGATLLVKPMLHGSSFFAFAFVAIALAAVLAGWRSGLAALATAQLTLWWLFMGDAWSFRLNDTAEASALVLATLAEFVVLAAIGLFQREVRNALRARDEIDRSRDLLVAELAHRVKNTLSVVQSLARQSLMSGSRIDGVAAFEERLRNIAASHDLITDNDWRPTSVAAVVERTISHFRHRPEQFRLSGPAVMLSPKRAVNLSLGLHELATNALKYGALSIPGGRVLIDWELAPDGDFALTWTEVDGPPVEPPRRRGFGSRMIERGLAAEMGGKVELYFAPAGLICVIRGTLE